MRFQFLLAASLCLFFSAHASHAASPAVAPGASCWSDGGSSRAEKTATDVPYQKNSAAYSSQKLDVYKPHGRQPPFPTVVFIHGGCFQWGAKDSVDSMEQIRRLTAAGYAVVSVEYRHADPSNPDPLKRNLYPASLEDVQDAVRWVREKGSAPPYNLKTDKLVALGQSAGATLAAYLGTRDIKGSSHKLDRFAAGYTPLAKRVTSVIDFFGRTDFEHRLPGEGLDSNGRDCAEEYLGEPRTRADAADFERASVLEDVDRKSSDFLIVHGTLDVNVAPAHSLELYNSLLRSRPDLNEEQKRQRFQFHEIQGAAHMFNEPHSMDEAWTQVCPFLSHSLGTDELQRSRREGATR